MATRTIKHPDVELSELDISQYTPGLAMTTNLVMGFTSRGEELIPQIITSKNSFINYYGSPQNDAERYAFAAAEEIFNQNGTLIFARVPYENASKGKYRYIRGSILDAAPIASADVSGLDSETSGNAVSTLESIQKLFNNAADSAFRRIEIDTIPSEMTSDEFDLVRTTNDLPVDVLTAEGNTGFIIVNTSRDVSTDEAQNTGLFTVMVPAYNALARKSQISVPTSGYFGWPVFNGIKSPQLVPSGSWEAASDFVEVPYHANIGSNSISRRLSSEYPQIKSTGTLMPDPQYLGQVALIVCKAYYSEDYDTKLTITPIETHIGSLNRAAVNSKGQSIFLGDVVNTNSEHIEFYMELGTDSDYLVKSSEHCIYTVVDSATPEDCASKITWPLLSFTEAESVKNIKYTTLRESMSTILESVKNIDEYEIDLVVDAGLSNIAQHAINAGASVDALYTPEVWSANNDITTSADLEAWRDTCDAMIQYCQFTRRDCFALLDAPRALVLQGNLKRVRNGNDETFDTSILPKMRLMTGLNTNFAAIYTNWMKILDQYTGRPIWLPESVKAVGAYNYVDRALNVFEAPAGLNNAIISGINDIAFNPTGEQADEIYEMGFNYAKKWPSAGFTIEGQKTLQNKSSAFDRVNVRRMFLRIERLFRKVALYFLYRPNNFVTRVQLYDLLAPILEQMKSAGGIVEYLLVINELNNTPEVIDQNELKLAVFIKPTKLAEFIRATFVATSQGVVLEEIQDAILPQL